LFANRLLDRAAKPIDIPWSLATVATVNEAPRIW
jgi:hypothetical protein